MQENMFQSFLIKTLISKDNLYGKGVPMKNVLAFLFVGMGMLILLPQVGSTQWLKTTCPVGSAKLAVMRSNLFAGTYDFGIFLSTDSGKSWTAVNSGLPENPKVWSLAVKDTDIFIGTDGNGVYLSRNCGVSWTVVSTGLPTNACVHALVIQGLNIFAGTWGDGIYLSSNNGTSWTACNGGRPDTVISLGVNGINIYAGARNSGVFFTTNNGNNWIVANGGLPPNNRNEVWSFASMGSNIFAGTALNGVFISTNNSTNWATVNSGLRDTNIISLIVNGTYLFAGTLGSSKSGSIFLSTNNGASWQEVNTGLPTDVSNLVWSLALMGSNLYAGCSDGVWRRPLSEMITLPIQVVVVNPKDSSEIYADSAMFKWQKAAPSVTKYHLQIATDSAMNFTLQDSTITDTVRLIMSLSNGQTYWWRVRAYNEFGWGPFSQKTTFKVNIITIPGAVTLFNPSDTAKVQTDSILLAWNKANPLVTRYHVQIATDSAMNFAQQDSSIIDTVKLLKSLSIGQTYWWHVRAYNAAGWGPFSQKRSFTYISTSVLPKTFEQSSFNFKGLSEVLQYSLPIQCYVSLKYYDIKGRLVGSLLNRVQNPGIYSFNFPISTWSKGTYIQVFKAGNFVKKERFVVVR
jgi:hypothetical protein